MTTYFGRRPLSRSSLPNGFMTEYSDAAVKFQRSTFKTLAGVGIGGLGTALFLAGIPGYAGPQIVEPISTTAGLAASATGAALMASAYMTLTGHKLDIPILRSIPHINAMTTTRQNPSTATTAVALAGASAALFAGFRWNCRRKFRQQLLDAGYPEQDVDLLVNTWTPWFGVTPAGKAWENFLAFQQTTS